MKLDVKFYPNTRDNTHCVQAVTKSVLKCIYPKRNFTLKELEQLSGKAEDKYTSMPGTLLGLQRLGLTVRLISSLDYSQFVRYGIPYLRKNFPAEFVEAQIKTSDLDSEMKDARNMLNHDIFQNRKITLSDLKDFLKDGWFVMVHVNSMLLKGKKGYSGHAVLLTGFDKNYVWFHDPGLPPAPNRKETKRFFMNAFNYAGIREAYLIRK